MTLTRVKTFSCKNASTAEVVINHWLEEITTRRDFFIKIRHATYANHDHGVDVMLIYNMIPRGNTPEDDQDRQEAAQLRQFLKLPPET